MDTADIKTATKILKIDKNGISVSAAGYSGAFTVLLDIDGKLDGAALKGIIDAALIKSGVLSDKQSNVTWNMATGAFAGKNVTITNLTATAITGERISGDTVSSGDGYTGSYHVDGATVTVRAGIITAVTPDPIEEQEPDPEEETPGGEEGENS